MRHHMVRARYALMITIGDLWLQLTNEMISTPEGERGKKSTREQRSSLSNNIAMAPVGEEWAGVLLLNGLFQVVEVLVLDGRYILPNVYYAGSASQRAVA